VLTDDWAPVENLLAPVVKTDQAGVAGRGAGGGDPVGGEEGLSAGGPAVREGAGDRARARKRWGIWRTRRNWRGSGRGAGFTYAAIIQLYPENVAARNRAAMILARQGYLGPALEQWGESLKINPAQPEVLNNLGALAMQEGNREAAIRYWRQALEYAPAGAAAELAARGGNAPKPGGRRSRRSLEVSGINN
jgi:hypothetical protein